MQTARSRKNTGRRKTFAPEFQQEQHHSEFRDLPNAQPSSLEKGVKPELYRKHSVRETNISTLEREKQQPIRLLWEVRASAGHKDASLMTAKAWS